MKLSEWMADRSVAETAARLLVTGACLRFWCKDQRRPRPHNMEAIRKLTRGAVTETDFPERKVIRMPTRSAKPAKKAPAKKPVPAKKAPAKKPTRRAA